MSTAEVVTTPWPTKAEVAEILRCEEKTVYRLWKRGKLEKRDERRGTVTVATYNPVDVARVKKDLDDAKDPKPFVMPTEASTSVDTLPATIPARPTAQTPIIVRPNQDTSTAALLAGLTRRSWPAPLFLTGSEAAEYSGLSRAALDRLVLAGLVVRVEFGNKKGHRYRRADLDRLADLDEHLIVNALAFGRQHGVQGGE